MTGLALRQRTSRSLLAGLLTGLFALGLSISPVVTSFGVAPAAAADGRVGLVIQDGAKSQPGFSCVTAAANMTGNDVLVAGKHALTFDKTNFLTTIDKFPAKIAPFDAKHPKYWSYWQLAPNGKWTYSASGSDKTHPKPGSIEGWFYVDGATYAPAPVTFSQVCPADSSSPSLSASGATQLPGAVAAEKKSSSTGPIVGTVIVVLVLGALAALVITRSRRAREH